MKIENIPAPPSRTITTAQTADREDINHFFDLDIRLHRHFDWYQPDEWIGHPAFLIEREGQRISSLLCATAENPGAAWIRSFGVRQTGDTRQCWQTLLSASSRLLKAQGIPILASLAFYPWYQALLLHSGFRHTQNIVILSWQGGLPHHAEPDLPLYVRPLETADLPRIAEVDARAFEPLWQNSLAELTRALQQKGIATVALLENQIVGYQLSTTTATQAHLARLAVDPAYQQRGIARFLLRDLLQQFRQRGFSLVTVNTQSDNPVSLHLYRYFGFVETHQDIAVYALNLT